MKFGSNEIRVKLYAVTDRNHKVGVMFYARNVKEVVYQKFTYWEGMSEMQCRVFCNDEQFIQYTVEEVVEE